jgi:hypothetical protein
MTQIGRINRWLRYVVQALGLIVALLGIALIIVTTRDIRHAQERGEKIKSEREAHSRADQR